MSSTTSQVHDFLKKIYHKLDYCISRVHSLSSFLHISTYLLTALPLYCFLALTIL